MESFFFFFKDLNEFSSFLQYTVAYSQGCMGVLDTYRELTTTMYLNLSKWIEIAFKRIVDGGKNYISSR